MIAPLGPTSPLRKQAAFTLVELVMVIMLLGILSATALPRFFSVSTYKQQVFFDDTLNAVRYAQKLAVATACNVQVSINADAYVLKQPANRSQCSSSSATFSLAVRNPGSGEASYSHAESGVSLSSNPTSFYFDALGRASANVTLTVAGTKTISVVRDTGFVYAN